MKLHKKCSNETKGLTGNYARKRTQEQQRYNAWGISTKNNPAEKEICGAGNIIR
jgi:hypothetical protein